MKLRSYVGVIVTAGFLAWGLATGVDRVMAQPQPAAPGAAEQVTPDPKQPAAGSADVSQGSAQASQVPPPVDQPDAQGSGTGPTGAPPADPAMNQSSSSTNPGGPADPKAPQAAAKPAGKGWWELIADRPIDEAGTYWMPKGVNRVAHDSDGMFYAVYALSIFFFVAIAGAVIYFTIRYRHRPGHKAEPSSGHNDALEITWTVIPTIICVFLFYYGWRTYVRVVTPPQKAVEIYVEAWRWSWEFTHQNGLKDSDLHVPVGTPVRLVMTSRDVLHAFYAPVMRVKQDIIPRRYTYAWFLADKPGTYRLNCAEYCGTDHSQMGKRADGRRAVVVVHEAGGYERYLADANVITGTPEEIGAKTYEKKGCISCHSVDGSAKVGPSFKGSWGTTIQLAGGGSAVVNEDYIRESIEVPTAKGRANYASQIGSMPSFDGQLKPEELAGLIAYIKSLK